MHKTSEYVENENMIRLKSMQEFAVRLKTRPANEVPRSREIVRRSNEAAARTDSGGPIRWARRPAHSKSRV
jgi:hypothetical protein